MQRRRQSAEVQASFGAWEPADLGPALQVRGVGVLGDRDEGGRDIVEDAGADGRARVAVHDDAQRLTLRLNSMRCEVRIIAALSAEPP